MSERGKPSGNRGGGGGGNSNFRGGYNREGNRGRGSNKPNSTNSNRPKTEGGSQGEKRTRPTSIIDLAKYLEQRVQVKFSAGREVTGILKGYDPLLNLVLDETLELLKDPEDPTILTESTRSLGLLVCRGPLVIMISPVEGYTEIENPFLPEQEQLEPTKPE